MKKIRVILISLLALAAGFSCTKDSGMHFGKQFNDLQVMSVEGMDVIPVQGDNNGGNITCEDVFNETGCSLESTSGKIDYDGGEGGTAGPITWTTDGTYVDWNSTVPVKIAVIVKGGPNATVYFSGCDNYIMSGSGLSAPINPNNGKPYELSNITFCYSVGEFVVAVKSKVEISNESGSTINFGVSTGGFYPFSGDWCSRLGVHYYSNNDVYDLKTLYTAPYFNIGSISVSDFTDEDGVRWLEIIVDGNDNVNLIWTSVYVGSLEGLENSAGEGICPAYSVAPWQRYSILGNTHTFLIPWDSIIK